VIAEILNVTRKTANKRVNDGLSMNDLVTISRGLDINPVQALVELGHIEYAEVEQFLDSDGQLVATATPGQLSLELARQLNPATVAPEIDMLAARRTEKSNGQVPPTKTPSPPPEHDGTVRDFDWEPGTYAADNSTNEGKAREERGEDPID
jgi:hypothetical protein